jgi:hypothetical protein
MDDAPRLSLDAADLEGEQLAALEAALAAAEAQHAQATQPSTQPEGCGRMQSTGGEQLDWQQHGRCTQPHMTPPSTASRTVCVEATTPTLFVVYGPGLGFARDALRRKCPDLFGQLSWTQSADQGAGSAATASEPHLALPLRHYERVVRVLDTHSLLPHPGRGGPTRGTSGRIPAPTLAALRRVAAASIAGTVEHTAQVRVARAHFCGTAVYPAATHAPSSSAFSGGGLRRSRTSLRCLACSLGSDSTSFPACWRDPHPAPQVQVSPCRRARGREDSASDRMLRRLLRRRPALCGRPSFAASALGGGAGAPCGWPASRRHHTDLRLL